jgi:hypothetical protein
MSAAAIYSELDACDVGGIVGGEECYRRGDFLGFAEANAFAICVGSLIVIPLRFDGVLRPIVGGFDVPPWSAIKRFWPLVWSHKR